MIIIAARSVDGVIGAGDRMPWDVSEEYERFLESVRGKTVIMGRRSHEIFGRDLTCRHAIVVSRSEAPAPGAVVVHSVDAACRLAEALGFEAFCAGGASIYRESLDLSDTMYLSTIKGSFQGDQLFPRIDSREWTVEHREECARYIFEVYRRVAG